MEVSPDVLRGTEAVAAFDEATYKAFVSTTFEVVVGKKKEEDLNSCVSNGFTLKVAYASLVSFIFEFAKLDLDPTSIQEFLTEHNFSESQSAHFISTFQLYLPTIRRQLASTSFHFPHIVDVEWRVDHTVKSDTLEKIGGPTFFVKLKVREKGLLKTVEFTANFEQMQDLVRKLKDATVSLERLDLSI
uniref:COMM domain-containing protein 3 n=1 Tax=Arcella intermedia TaxID=1963864 RepID=A0A6B2LK83_9EUKA